MVRGKRFWGALAVVCLVGAGCARLEKAAGLTSPAADPRPPTAIALSVLADSIYLLDPESGRQQTVAAGLADFQSGYAAWSPDRTLLAYGDAGIWLVNGPAAHEGLAAGSIVLLGSLVQTHWVERGDMVTIENVPFGPVSLAFT